MSRRHPPQVRVLAAVAVGGALGASARHAVSVALPDVAGGFPWTILAVNVSGCFLLALLPAFPVVRRRPLLPPLLGTGVLGGFTTMSTYAEQSRALVAAGRPGAAATYVVGTLVACLAAVVAADRFGDRPARVRFDAAEGDR